MLSRGYVGAVAVAVLLVACTNSSTIVKLKDANARKLAPEFTLRDSAGQTVKLSDYRGKVVLLNFWATWCGPCKVEMPWFMDFEQKYKDRDFAVLGVSMDDDGWKSVKPYLDQHKINYRVVVGTEEVSQQYGNIDSLPTTFILDRDGRIASTHFGLVSKSEYQNEILKLLDTPKRARNSAPVVAFPAFLRAR